MNASTVPSRHLFLSLALVLALVVVGLGGTSFQRQVDAFQPLGFEGLPAQGAWRVTAVGDPRTGLREGDEILLVGGERPAFAERLRELLGRQPQAELLVKRGEGLETVTYLRPPLDINFPYLILTAVGAVYLLIGLYTAFKDRKLQARLFYLWCLCSAALYILSPTQQVPFGAVDKAIFLGDQLTRNLLPALTLHLFLVFPTRMAAAPRRALPLVYLPAVGLVAFHVPQVLLDRPLVAARTFLLVDRLELFLLVFFSLLAVLALIVRLARRPQWEQRRQVQWIAIGMLGGYVPFLVLYVVPLSLGLGWPSWTTAAAVMPLGLVPLAFAWAILKYKLWDIGPILRTSISYSLTVLVGLCGFSLINLAIQRGLAGEMAVLRNFLTFAGGLAIAGVLVPTRNVIAAGLERLQYRNTLPQRRALLRLGRELLLERDLERLSSVLLERLADGLMAHANLYLVASGDNGETPRLQAAHAEVGIPAELAADAFEPGFWGRDLSPLQAIHLPAAETTAEEQLFAAGYRYALPLRVRDRRVGIALLSHKFDGEPLSSEDLDLARALLNQAALAIENAQLLDEVRSRLEEVARLEEHAKGIIESSPAGIAVLDAEERVITANKAFASIAEVPSREILGRPLTELLPLRPLPDPADGLVEVSYSESSGRERNLQMSVAVFRRRDDKPLRVLIVQDTSDRIAMETALKEKERLASLGMLAAGVAHEVNTPLTGISSYTQLLLADLDESSPHYEILKKVERQSFRAAQIVNNLLEFSRNRRGELHPVDLELVISECTRMLDDRAVEAKVEVVWEPRSRRQGGGGAGLMVLGHEGELHQVFTNLMVNAIDAMAAGGGRLTLAAEAAGDRIRATVSDTGPGIPPERLERIFQPFFSSKLNKGGTGLGLAIVYNIVRRHRGEIHAANHGGAPGCTFTVDLPRYEAR